MSLPRYPAYKASGVEWLGEVPERWTLPKIKGLASFAGGGTPSRENMSYWNGAIPWVSPKDMKFERIVGAEECISEAGLRNSASSLLPPEQVLMVVRSGILRHTIPVAINEVAVALNQDMKALAFDPKRCLPEFFLRWVQGLNDQLLLVWAKQGATVESIEHGYLADTVIPLPGVEEQATITAFLDRETAKIDALVAAQQQLIALLKEKRQAVISHAVTKGLNPDAPMKDSGVVWLGTVPEHWDVLILRRCSSSVQTGITPSSEPPTTDLEEGMVWYTPVDFGDSLLLTSSTREISLQAVASKEARIFPPGSVLIVSIGATLGKVGYAREASSANQQINAVIPNERIDGYFLSYSLLVKAEVMRFLSNASTIGIMNQERTKDIWIAVPPRQEQGSISAYLDVETARLDALTGAAQRAIELLQERRTALISAAVTGQIDVRSLAPAESAA